MRLFGGVVVALISTSALNVSLFLQHGAVHHLDRLSPRRPVAFFTTLFRSIRWLFGYGIGWVGWGLYALALFLAPISLVQGVSAGGIGVLALGVRFSRHDRLRRGEALGVGAAMLGLVLLLVSLSDGQSSGHSPGAGTVALLVVFLLLGGVLLAVVISMRRGSGPGLAVMAGISYAAGDVATKGAISDGAPLLVPLLLACSLSGFGLLQLSLQRAGALQTAGLATLLMNAVPIAAGVAFFHEALPGPLGATIRSVAFLLVVVGAMLLATSEREATTSPAGLRAT